jgi:hypothetical protein
LEFLLCTLTPEVQCQEFHRNHVIWRTKIAKCWRNGNDSKQPYCTDTTGGRQIIATRKRLRIFGPIFEKDIYHKLRAGQQNYVFVSLYIPKKSNASRLEPIRNIYLKTTGDHVDMLKVKPYLNTWGTFQNHLFQILAVN